MQRHEVMRLDAQVVCLLGQCILQHGKVDQIKIGTIHQLFFQTHTVTRISLPYPILLGPSLCNCPLCFWFLGITIDPDFVVNNST